MVNVLMPVICGNILVRHDSAVLRPSKSKKTSDCTLQISFGIVPVRQLLAAENDCKVNMAENNSSVNSPVNYQIAPIAQVV